MKNKLVLVGFMGFAVLFGCSQVSQDISAEGESKMKVISSDEVHRGYAVVLKHKDTGCYYTYVSGGSSSTSSAPTQMFIEKDGKSIPYYEK